MQHSEPISAAYPTLNLSEVERHILQENGGVISIGGEIITPELRSVLRDEALYMRNSRLWEIFNASIKNESADIALRQSQNWEHVLAGKQLYHWAHFLENVIHRLAKK